MFENGPLRLSLGLKVGPWNVNNRLVCLCGQLGAPLALPACGVPIAKGHAHAVPRSAKTSNDFSESFQSDHIVVAVDLLEPDSGADA